MEYPFPGNVRELEHIIERGVALENTNIILPETLVMVEADHHDGKNGSHVMIPPEGVNLNEEMARIERTFIKKALEQAHHSKTKAAELLHISFDSLRYRMEKLNIE
jgi:two-component system response regulator PilR (NtrC family)